MLHLIGSDYLSHGPRPNNNLYINMNATYLLVHINSHPPNEHHASDGKVIELAADGSTVWAH